MKKVFCFLVIFFWTVQSESKEATRRIELEEFEKFRKNFRRNYNGEEEHNFRRENFVKNWKIIEEHNKLFDEGKVTYKMGVNEMSDESDEEFRKRLGLR